MANRLMQQFTYSFIKKYCKVVAEISIASNGEVSAVYGPGVTSAAKSGTGQYTIVLDDKYQRFLGAKCSLLAATAVDLVPQLVSFTDSTKTLIVKTLAGASATTPNAACKLYVEISFRDSTQAY